ncbi:MAG: glycosyltransferase family 2 protein [Patescibacteria group bacterium]
MASITSMVFYVLIFLSVYVQVFFLVTFFENRRKIIIKNRKTKLAKYPTITVIVSCWNEDKTICKTIRSLLDLDYPKEKLKIFLVDDGSTDNTWYLMKHFEKQSNIFIFHKENGGKHTAINLGLQHVETEFVACLDADSFVHPQALNRMMQCFLENKDIMAVIPATIIYNPKNFAQSIQRIEYFGSIFIKKMLSFLNGLHVTPGTLPIYRREVFDRLGGFRKAHNTEDGEIALRMHQHNLRIDYCHNAYVYTVSPDSLYKLYKQRLRWYYGFIKNLIDYKHLLLKPKFGVFSLLTLPSGVISILGIVFLFLIFVSKFIDFFVKEIIKIQAVGINGALHLFKFDWFYFNIKSISLILIGCFFFVVFTILVGRKIVENRFQPSFYIIFYIITYSIIAPVWFLKAVYNVIVSERPSWR